MGSGMLGVGSFAIILGILSIFMDVGAELLILIPIGLLLCWIGASIENEDQKRHQNDYGNVARCPKCGSTKVYGMTYDDKSASIAFWGAASSKIGKRFHCDNCGNEW